MCFNCAELMILEVYLIEIIITQICFSLNLNTQVMVLIETCFPAEVSEDVVLVLPSVWSVIFPLIPDV